MDEHARLPRTVRGKRPEFFETPGVDERMRETRAVHPRQVIPSTRSWLVCMWRPPLASKPKTQKASPDDTRPATGAIRRVFGDQTREERRFGRRV